MKRNITLIYILGAGRSGSTILSTILGASGEVFNCADLMQIYEYGCYDKKCNDGNTLFESPFWSKVLKRYDSEGRKKYCELSKENQKLEFHKNFLNVFLGMIRKCKLDKYIWEQCTLISAISETSNMAFVVDSSKYPTRGLLLKKHEKINVKIIYNIRDIRGVVNSFSKNVQTKKSPFASIIYYNLINIMSELVCFRFSKHDKYKMKYEELTSNPKKSLESLSMFLCLDFTEVCRLIENNEKIEIGPVIEGNRMVKNKRISLLADNEWQFKTGWFKRIIYYMCAFPFMIINRYKI